MTLESPRPNRTVWIVLFFSFVLAIPIYALLLFALIELPPGPRDLGVLRPILYSLGAINLALSVWWMRTRACARVTDRARGTEGPLPPERFQVESIAAIALAESVAVFGFVLCMLGASRIQFVAFGGVALVVLLAVHLPAGLGYWRELEESGGAGPR